MRPNRLLAAALLLSALAVRAEQTVSDAALRQLGASAAPLPGELDAFYDGSTRRSDAGTAVPARPFRAAPPPPLARPASAPAAQTPPPAPDSAPLPMEEVRRYVEFLPAAPEAEAPGGSGVLSTLRSAASAVSDAVVDTRQEKFSEDIIAKMQQSATGRRVLAELIAEAKLAGVRVSVQPKRYEGSSLYTQNGTERPNGTRGQMYTDSRTYYYNALFAEMKDRDLALEMVAGNAAHEFHHQVFAFQTQRLLVAKNPGYKEVINLYDQLDEAWARPIGYLTGAELNRGRSTPYTEEGRSLANAEDKDAFFEGMALWGDHYVTRLMPKDWKDPIAAYQRRAATLKTKIADMRNTMNVWVPERISELDNLDRLAGLADSGPEYAHYKELKAQGSWDEIRSYVQSRRTALPTDIKEFENAQKTLADRLAFLKAGALPAGSPGYIANGARRLSDIQHMAVDPQFLALKARFEKDVKAYSDYVDAHGLPAAVPPGGKWTFTQYYEFIKNDRAKYPAHWTAGGG